MTEIGTHRPLDHTGDAAFEAEAGSEPSLYATCAAALFEILAEGGNVASREERVLEISAPDREVLLVRWLRELLFLHGAEGWIFREFEVACGGGEAGLWLRARARGERYDPARHVIRTELKAVTYHQVHARLDPDGRWRARVVLDV